MLRVGVSLNSIVELFDSDKLLYTMMLSMKSIVFDTNKMFNQLIT